jgi:hypothetical protein
MYYVIQNIFKDSGQIEQMSLSRALKTEFLLNNIYKFSLCLTRRTLHLRYKQPDNALQENNRCLFRELTLRSTNTLSEENSVFQCIKGGVTYRTTGL